MPVLQRASYIACLTETTSGTLNAPAAANGIICYEADLQPLNESTSTERHPIVGHMGTQVPVPGLQGGTFKCKTFLVGSGIDPTGTATAPYYAPLMIGCGWQQDVTAATNVKFKPASYINEAAWSSTADFAGWDTLSIFEFAKVTAAGGADHVYKLKGAAGNSKISAKVGEPLTVEFDMKGCYVAAVDDATVSTPTFTNGTVVPKPFLGATATWTPNGGSAHTFIGLRSFEIDLGCEVVFRTDANDSSGRLAAVIVDRKPTWKITVEDPNDYDSAAGQDWWAAFVAQTFGALNIGPIGSTAGNIVEIDVPVAGILKVSSSFEDGIRVLEVEGSCANSAITTGDDEIVITLT